MEMTLNHGQDNMGLEQESEYRYKIYMQEMSNLVTYMAGVKFRGH